MTPTMRTHPLVQDTNCTNTVNLGITTRCSMKCPNCSIDINGIRDRGEAKDASLSDIAVWLGTLTRKGPLKRVHVTGGEPTLHKDFADVVRFVSQFKMAGLVEHMSLETNGFKAEEWRYSVNLFDLVFCTHYQKDAVYPGSPDNTDKVEFLQRLLGDRLVREEPVRHLPGHLLYWPLQSLEVMKARVTNHPGLPDPAEVTACSKWHEPGLPAGVYDGMVYKCCVGRGIDKNVGTPLTADWRDKVTQLIKGCARCAFRGT